MLQRPLFENARLRLAAVDLKNDPVIESPWTYDLNYARHFNASPARPLAVFEIEKFYKELLDKQRENAGSLFNFMIRLKEDDRLLGFIRIMEVQWVHGVGWLALAIGEPAYKGIIEAEALELALNYAFEELNLFRLTVDVAGYDMAAIQLYEGAGFSLEVRQREMIYRDNRFWDHLHYGILREEWQQRALEVAK